MLRSDSEHERRRLAEFYSGLADEELVHLAENGDELTDAACDVLAEELERRGLEIEETSSSAFESLENRNLVVIRNFRDLPEALLAKGLLDSVGIACHLGDENIVRMDWFISNFVGGVKLRVSPEDFAIASRILAEPMPPDFDVTGVGHFEQPTCPHCQSRDISFEALNKPIAYGSAWLGVPIPVARNRWKCHSCGTNWQGSEAD